MIPRREPPPGRTGGGGESNRRLTRDQRTNWLRAYPGQSAACWEVKADLRARQLSARDAGLWDEFVGDRSVGEAMDEVIGLLIEAGIIGRKRAA